MGDKITLKVENRDVHGKKVKNLRKQGITPGVVYGPGMEPSAVQADSGELARVVREAGKHTPVMLSGAKKRIAMIKDVDYDATKHGVVRHVSFHAVKADEPVEAEVPIKLIGEGESAERLQRCLDWVVGTHAHTPRESAPRRCRCSARD